MVQWRGNSAVLRVAKKSAIHARTERPHRIQGQCKQPRSSLKEVSSGLAMQAAVSAAGIVLMVAIATLLSWEAKLDRRGPKLF